MTSALQVLCAHLFDYAGLFPPAQLDLNSALLNYSKYQTEHYHQLLGKFVLPVNKCENVVAFFSERKIENLIDFSLLFSQSKSANDLDQNLNEDLKKIFFLDKNKNCSFTSFEFCLPLDVLMEEKLLFLYFDKINNIVSLLHNKTSKSDLFCEIPLFSASHKNTILKSISKYNSFHSQKISIKLRTGGITAESIPSAEKLSDVFLLLSQYKLPFKVTAGLHVPIPNFNPHVNANMHGFLNVIFSSMFSFFSDVFIQKSSFQIKDMLEKILISLNYSNIKLQYDQISFYLDNKEFVFSKKMIFDFRKNYFKGIGTCDFFEPIDLLCKNFDASLLVT